MDVRTIDGGRKRLGARGAATPSLPKGALTKGALTKGTLTKGILVKGLLTAAILASNLLVGSGCSTAFEVVDENRTDYVPRMQVGDRTYNLDVRVVDDSKQPVPDGMLVRLRGVRYLNGFRDGPEHEFYVHGRSGDGGEPGLVHFEFPMPPDPEAFDLYLVIYHPSEIPTTHYFPGKWWTLKWLHEEIALNEGSASVKLIPDD